VLISLIMASILAQLVVDGMAMGLVYVLLASGFNLIIGISGILFLAYGQFYMLGAYILWGLMVLFKVPFFISLCVATAVSGILGGITYRLIFQRILSMKRQFLNGIVAALGLLLLIGQAALLGFGTSSRGVGSVFTGILEAGGIRISVERLVLIILALAVLLGLHLFLQRTNIGRGMRAVSFNPDIAALQGVNASRIFLVTMVVGCALAGFAGGIMAPVFAVTPEMGTIVLVILLVVMLGGVGSMPGAILAGLILGLTLSFGQYFIGTGLVQILFFAVIGIIVFFRPGGLLGQPTEELPI
jgi:branched-chain amino acid transport system permease protein